MTPESVPLFSIVQLINEHYLDDGSSVGRQGAVVGIYPDNAYEVEFSDEDGITIALLAVQRQDIKILWLPAELPVEP